MHFWIYLPEIGIASTPVFGPIRDRATLASVCNRPNPVIAHCDMAFRALVFLSFFLNCLVFAADEAARLAERAYWRQPTQATALAAASAWRRAGEQKSILRILFHELNAHAEAGRLDDFLEPIKPFGINVQRFTEDNIPAGVRLTIVDPALIQAFYELAASLNADVLAWLGASRQGFWETHAPHGNVGLRYAIDPHYFELRIAVVGFAMLPPDYSRWSREPFHPEEAVSRCITRLYAALKIFPSLESVFLSLGIDPPLVQRILATRHQYWTLGTITFLLERLGFDFKLDSVEWTPPSELTTEEFLKVLEPTLRICSVVL